MCIENLSLSQLKKFGKHFLGIGNFPSRILVKNYGEFIQVLYQDIDDIVFNIQKNPELRQLDEEDRLNIDIVNMLTCLGYNASHDQKIGGHTDISVTKNLYLWIGEAKIYRGPEYLWKGFQQLNTRYSTGDSNQNHGGLLIYIKQPKAKSLIDKWKVKLVDEKLEGYSYSSCPNRELDFYSNHIHERSGLIFTIKHIPIILHFSPQDIKVS